MGVLCRPATICANYLVEQVNAGKVIPGYGHAVLRTTDPRFMVQYDFAKRYLADDENFQIVRLVYEILPGVLGQNGKVKSPWPNVDAINGALQYHFGVTQFNFYTVMFGVSRILGLCAHAVWARALGKPIERPKSLTTAMLEEMIAQSTPQGVNRIPVSTKPDLAGVRMPTKYQFFEGKVVLRIRNTICDTPDELLTTDVFADVLKRYVQHLSRQRSRLLRLFPNPQHVTASDLHSLAQTLRLLIKLPAEMVAKVQDDSRAFLNDRGMLDDFVENFYNYWRSLHRLVICDSIGDRYDRRPYRTFNDTVETLMHVIRGTYRDVRENITGDHPQIYRQVSAGAEIGVIARPMDIPYPAEMYSKLNRISIANQVLIYPPMIFETPMNKRSGVFQKVDYNPVEKLDLDPMEWLCYPAKVGIVVDHGLLFGQVF